MPCRCGSESCEGKGTADRLISEVKSDQEKFAAENSFQSVVAEAGKLVHGARQASYSHPFDDFSRTAALANALFQKKLYAWADRAMTAGLTEPTPEFFDAEFVATFMVLVKLSREAHQHKRDNLVDAAGYVETLAMVLDRRGIL
jgi:hypothetical protein